MKHITAISKKQAQPMPANLDVLGLRTLVGLLNEIIGMLSGLSGLIKGIPLPDGGDGGGGDDGHDDEH